MLSHNKQSLLQTINFNSTMATTISYTSKFADVHNPINNIENELSSAWEKHEHLDVQMAAAQARYYELLKDLQYAELNISVIDFNITMTQDNINELSIAKYDMLNDEQDGDIRVVDECSCDYATDFVSSLDEDYECKPKERKVRSDVLTVGAAIMSNKSSKNHKLKPKSTKKDRSKSPEAKGQSKKVRASHM